MNLNKKILACAVATACAGMGMGTAQAADILTMSITDVNGDGVAGGFSFGAPGTTNYSNFFDDSSSITFTPVPALPTLLITNTPSSLVGITADGVGEGVNVFSAGFLFSGGPFSPASLNGTGFAANTTTPDGIDGNVSGGATSLTMTQFHWGGQFGTNYFPLTGDGLFGKGNSAWQGQAECPISSAKVCYQLAWDAFIVPQGGFTGPTNWQLEGVASLDGAITLDISAKAGAIFIASSVPVPAAAWLFGSGLLGLVGVARRRNNK